MGRRTMLDNVDGGLNTRFGRNNALTWVLVLVVALFAIWGIRRLAWDGDFAFNRRGVVAPNGDQLERVPQDEAMDAH